MNFRSFYETTQAMKMATSSVPEAEVAVGENGTLVSFAEWDVPSDVEENSTVAVAVATMGAFASEGTVCWCESNRRHSGKAVLRTVLLFLKYELTMTTCHIFQVWKA